MKIKTFYSIFFLAVLLLSFSCKKDKVLTGTIEGKVDLLIDEFGDTLPLVNITVKLASGTDTLVTFTDAAGNYEFTEVKTGNYDVIIGETPIAPYHFYIDFIGGNSSPYVLESVKLTYQSIIEPTIERCLSGYSIHPDTIVVLHIRIKPYFVRKRRLFIVADNFSDTILTNDTLYIYTKNYKYFRGSVIYVYGGVPYDHSFYIDTNGKYIDPAISSKVDSIKPDTCSCFN